MWETLGLVLIRLGSSELHMGSNSAFANTYTIDQGSYLNEYKVSPDTSFGIVWLP